MNIADETLNSAFSCDVESSTITRVNSLVTRLRKKKPPSLTRNIFRASQLKYPQINAIAKHKYECRHRRSRPTGSNPSALHYKFARYRTSRGKAKASSTYQ